MSTPQVKLNWQELTPVDRDAADAMVAGAGQHLASKLATYSGLKDQALSQGYGVKLNWDELTPSDAAVSAPTKPKLPGENLWRQFEDAKSKGDLVSAGGFAAQLKQKGWEAGADQYGNPYVKPPKASGYEFKEPRQFDWKVRPSLADALGNYQPAQPRLPQVAPLSPEQQVIDRRYANEQARRAQLPWYKRAAESAADVVMGTHEDASRMGLGEGLVSGFKAVGGGAMEGVGAGLEYLGTQKGPSADIERKLPEPLRFPSKLAEVGRGMRQVGGAAAAEAGQGVISSVERAAGEMLPIFALPEMAPAKLAVTIGLMSGAQVKGRGASTEEAVKQGLLTGIGVAAGGALASRVPFKGITGWAARTGAATAGMEAPQIAATGRVPTVREVLPNLLLMGGLEGMTGPRPQPSKSAKGATEALTPEEMAAGQKWAMEGQTVSLTPEQRLQHQNDAVAGLVQLGYGKKEASAKVAQMTNANPNLGAEQLVRGALGAGRVASQQPAKGRPTDVSEIIKPEQPEPPQPLPLGTARNIRRQVPTITPKPEGGYDYSTPARQQRLGTAANIGTQIPEIAQTEGGVDYSLRPRPQLPYQQMSEQQPRLRAPLGTEMPATAQPAQLPPASPEALQESARFVQGPEGVIDRSQPVMRVDNQRIIPTGESALAQRLSTYGQREIPTPARTETPRPSEAAARPVETAAPERRVEESAADQRAKDVGEALQRGLNDKTVTVYHGTTKNFEGFQTTRKAGVEAEPTDQPTFFSLDPALANEHAGKGEGGRVIPAHLSVRKLFDYRDPKIAEMVQKDAEDGKLFSDDERYYERLGEFGRGAWSLMESKEMQDYIKLKGYDAFTLNGEGSLSIGVFDPRQVVMKLGTKTPNDVVAQITARQDYPPESLPDLHDQMNAANIPMHEQVDALNQAGFNFKDTFQLGGTVRALRAEANGETLPEITHRRFGKLLVLGKTPDNNKLITVGNDGVTRAPQNPLGVSGNSHVKQYKASDLENLPTVEWKDLGLQSEGWPTTKQLELLGKLTGKAYGPHLSEVPDDVVKAVWPEVYRKRQLANEFGKEAGATIEDAATQPAPDDAPQFVRDAQTRMNKRQNVKLDPEAGVNQMIPDLVDAGIVYGHKVYQAGQSFFDWSRGMIKQLGNSIKPHLDSIWAMVKNQMDVKTPGQEGFLTIPSISPAVKRKAKDVARSLYIQGYLGPSGAARVGVGLVAKQTLLDWPGNLIGSAIDAATVATGVKSGGRAYEFNVTDIGDVINRGAKRAGAAMLNAIQGKTSPILPYVHETDIGHPAATAALNAVTRLYATKEAGARGFGYETAINDFASLMARQDPLNLGGSRNQRLKYYKDNLPDLAQLQAVAATTTISTLSQYANVIGDYAAKARKMTPAQQMQYEAQLMSDPAQLMHEYGVMEGERQVGAQPNALARALQNVGKEGVTIGGQEVITPSSRTARGLQFAIRTELPFLKRPMNALAQTLSDYTGLTAGRKIASGELQGYLNDTLSKPDQQRFVKSVGKGMAGLGFIGLGLALQKHGAMTGVLDEDKSHFGGALKIGDSYYQIGHVPFVGWLMTFGATLGEAIERAESGGASELPGGLVKGAFKMVAEHPMLRGLQTLSDTYSQVKSGRVGPGKGLLQHGAQVASRFIPSPIASVAQYMDRDEQGNVIQRSQKGSLAAPFQARIPGEREKLPAVRDRRTGEIVSAPYFSPVNVRSASQVPDKQQIATENVIQGQKEQARQVTDREKIKREITDRMRTGKNLEAAQKQMADAFDQGVLSEDDILDIGRKSGLTMTQQDFNALPLEQALGAMEQMPKSVREQFKGSLAQKVERSFDRLPRQDVKRLMPRVQQILQ